MDSSQSDVPGTRAVFAGIFQVIEKKANEGYVEILDSELRRHFVESFFGKLQKQTKAVAIGRYGVRACLLLAQQPIEKEGLKKRRELLAEIMATPLA